MYQTTGSATFDASGRTLSVTDVLNHTTTTTYVPALGGVVSKIETTNPKQQKSTVTLDPARGTPLTATDVAGRVAQARYDALGRVVEVWQPGRAPGAEPNVKYQYRVDKTLPLAVTTKTLVDHGAGTNYLTSINLYDSSGRLRQTQVDDVSNPTKPVVSPWESADSRVVSEIFYDSHGRQQRSNNRYLTTGAPSTSLITADASNVDDRTVTTYDGAGRPTVVTAYRGDTATRDTKTFYGGDHVTTIPPQGGVPSTVISDARGRTTELVQYTAAPTVTGDVASGGNPQSTRYTYNPKGQLVELTDALGTKWGFEYDFLGRQSARVDPDSGRSTTTYNLAGQVTSTTDALNQVLSYDYDEIGRKTTSWEGAPFSRVKLASWAYDTAANGVGKLHSGTRHTPSGDYTVETSGYNSRGLPFDQIVKIPTGQEGLAGTYKTQLGYTSTSLPTYVTPAHAGGLPAENIQFTYDRFGQPQSTRGVNTIVAASTYSSAGEPLRYALGGLDQVALTFDRDTHTHRVNQITMTAVKAVPQIDDVQYTHDPAGNLTKAYNTQGHPDFGGTERTECFTYDGLNRLKEAWTSATANTCAATPGAGNVGGGTTPYWSSWEFNKVGSRTKQTQHQIAGGLTGDTTTTYTYATPGHAHAVTSTATSGPMGDTSTSYLYDAAGNTDTRVLPAGTQDLTWDKTGRLVNVDLTTTTPTNDSSYVYDADGNQLIRTEPGKTTLYLPGQEITRNTTTGAVTGTRYYTHNGTTVAVRNTGQNPTYLKADMHGTNQVAVASNNYTVTRRTQDPYGDPLGAQGTTPWPDTHGFLNKPTNTTTGLTDIGARNYDPTLGAFISVDPILDMANPQSWTGYAYANNNPTTLSDPTGLISDLDNEKQEARYREENNAFAEHRKNQEWETGNSPATNDPGELAQHFAPFINTPTLDGDPGNFWRPNDGWSGSGNKVCFGRTACNKAMLHILEHPDDIAGAKRIAAFYCVENFDVCDEHAVAYGIWSNFKINFPYLLAIGAARGVEKSGVVASEVVAAGSTGGGGAVSRAVSDLLVPAQQVAKSRGFEFAALGKGKLWANKDESLALRTPGHVASVKELGFTKGDIGVIRDYYAGVAKTAPANPSARQRADLMTYIVENW